jgi:type II restriction/modification system DNA methylase subunit YeeA
MMLFLLFNVFSHSVNNGFGDRYREIFILPLKFVFTNAILINPERRFALYQLHNLTHALVNAKGNKTVNMVSISIDKVNINAFFFGVFPDMVKNSLSYFAGFYKWNSMLG